jgi:3-methylcrotonyl-CoA carboxylase alpha subunit
MSDKTVSIGGEPTDVHIEREGARLRSGSAEIELMRVRDSEAEIRAGGKTYIVPFVLDGTRVSFAFDGEIYVADVTARGTRGRARHREQSMSAPMPGMILKILVRPGDVVSKGAPLIVLEAMKMEHQIVAPHDGTVAAVNCSEGQLVQPGLELVELAASE